MCATRQDDVLMGAPDTAKNATKQRAALLRSMSLTRMLDYGMDHWDATQLIGAPVPQPWDDAAALLADAQLERANAAAARGDVETAVSCYRRATAALVFAQMAYNSDTAEKRSLYERLSRAYQDAADLDADLRVRRPGGAVRDEPLQRLARPPHHGASGGDRRSSS